MNSYDEDSIKSVVKDVLIEEERNDYIYLKNKAYIIEHISDDEEIEKIFNERELNFIQDLSFMFKKKKSLEEQIEEYNNQNNKYWVIRNAKDLLDKNLNKLIYDEIKYDEFYSNYIKFVKENASKFLVNKEELEKIEYVLSEEEIKEVLEKNKYKLELVFNEENIGYVCIVKK